MDVRTSEFIVHTTGIHGMLGEIQSTRCEGSFILIRFFDAHDFNYRSEPGENVYSGVVSLSPIELNSNAIVAEFEGFKGNYVCENVYPEELFFPENRGKWDEILARNPVVCEPRI